MGGSDGLRGFRRLALGGSSRGLGIGSGGTAVMRLLAVPHPRIQGIAAAAAPHLEPIIAAAGHKGCGNPSPATLRQGNTLARAAANRSGGGRGRRHGGGGNPRSGKNRSEKGGTVDMSRGQGRGHHGTHQDIGGRQEGHDENECHHNANAAANTGGVVPNDIEHLE